MFDAPLRHAKDRLGEPLAAALKDVSPNAVSVMAFAVGLLAAGLAAGTLYSAAFTLWLMSRALDGLDGLIARLHHKQSDFGGYLDILLDFAVYAAVPVGLVLGAPSFDRYLALALMLAAFYVNGASWMFLAALLEKRGGRYVGDPSAPPGLTSVVMPTGLVGGTETILAYSLFLLWPDLMATLFAIFGLLVFLTTLQRLAWAWRHLK